MTLHVVLRCAGRPSRKRRPAWFSKSLCLASLLRAAEQQGEVRFTFVCDGPLPSEIGRLMADTGRVVQLGGRGNSASYRATTRVAARTPGDPKTLCYVCEDDYLHLPRALEGLVRASLAMPKNAYVSLYDHPDRYVRSDDLKVAHVPSFTVGDRVWSIVESTTMSYATRSRTLKHDLPLHIAVAFGSYPRDRLLWRSLQGLGVRKPLRLVFPGRLLFGARPGLSVHCEEGALSAGIEWASEADDAQTWAIAHGIPLLEEW